MYNGDYDLLIYSYIHRRHISILTSKIKFPNLLRKCCWTETYFEGAELGVVCKSMLFYFSFNKSGYKEFSFNTQKFSLRFKSVLIFSGDF